MYLNIKFLILCMTSLLFLTCVNSRSSEITGMCLKPWEKERFLNGNYFSNGTPYWAIDSAGTYTMVYIQILNNYNDCLGITLKDNETIVLECPGQPPKEPGCFDVFSSKANSHNTTEVSTEKIEKICFKRGKTLVTPNGSTIHMLNCKSTVLVSVPYVTPPRE